MNEEHYAKGALSDGAEDASGGSTHGAPSHHHPHHGVHVEHLDDGTHLVTKHHKDGSHSRHSAANLDKAVDHVMSHMGGDEEGGMPAEESQSPAEEMMGGQ